MADFCTESRAGRADRNHGLPRTHRNRVDPSNGTGQRPPPPLLQAGPRATNNHINTPSRSSPLKQLSELTAQLGLEYVRVKAAQGGKLVKIMEVSEEMDALAEGVSLGAFEAGMIVEIVEMEPTSDDRKQPGDGTTAVTPKGRACVKPRRVLITKVNRIPGGQEITGLKIGSKRKKGVEAEEPERRAQFFWMKMPNFHPLLNQSPNDPMDIEQTTADWCELSYADLMAVISFRPNTQTKILGKITRESLLRLLKCIHNSQAADIDALAQEDKGDIGIKILGRAADTSPASSNSKPTASSTPDPTQSDSGFASAVAAAEK
ncbi:hypothetical protein BU26DRAFT_510622 [Trematosphaeria pertusa]|uniref:Uncharacterized protein n=1 Tax=Trematosphaeria pertusa TaxID=390896 RepID=A0A6A6HVH1_9PLEO|nr:uncharacterized protein BU26DRAFT_510622 [Trematosphaeria pertusa]KAF2242194.1 hypothetical protein BU26DRAFT_510622 [Trematosphaeria pertusa]